jgi:hypothetical protein
MKKLIYLSILFFFWGCMFEETPQEISSSSEQPRNGLALLFEQKLNARLLTRSGELEMLSDSRTPLTEHVRYGYSTAFSGHYFIVPLHQESTGVQLLRKKSSEAGFSVLKAKLVEGNKYIATECK